MGVVLQVERPGRRGAQVPTLVQVVNDERLQGGRLDMLAVAVAGKGALVLHQGTQQAAGRCIDRHGGQAGLPFTRPEFVLIGAGHGDHWPDAQLHAVGLEQEDIEQVQITFTGAVAAAGVGAGADRRGGAQQLRHTDEIVGRNRQRAAHQQVIAMDVGVVVPGGVVVLQAHPRSHMLGEHRSSK